MTAARPVTDLDVRDNCDTMALHRAVKEGHEEMVRLLLEKVGDPRANGNYEMTALEWVECQKRHCVKSVQS